MRRIKIWQLENSFQSIAFGSKQINVMQYFHEKREKALKCNTTTGQPVMECVLECLASILCGDDLLEQLGAPRSSGMSVSPHINILCMGSFSGLPHCHHTDLKEQRGFLFPKSQQGTDEQRVPRCLLFCLIETYELSDICFYTFW